MPEKPFPTLRPGQHLTAAESNRLHNAVEDQSRVVGGGGIGINQGSGSPVVENIRPPAIYAMLGSSNGNAYAWTEQIEAAGGTFVGSPLGGTVNSFPLYEINGVAGLPQGLLVRAWASAAGDSYLFISPIGGPQAPGPTAKIVTNVCDAKSGGNVTSITVEYTPITLPAGTVVGTPTCSTDPSDCCVQGGGVNGCGPCNVTPTFMKVIGAGFDSDSRICAMNGTNIVPLNSSLGCVWVGNTSATGGSCSNFLVYVYLFNNGTGEVDVFSPAGEVIYKFTLTANNCCSSWTATLSSNNSGLVVPSTITVTSVCSGDSGGGGGGGTSVSNLGFGTTLSSPQPTLTVTAGGMLVVSIGYDIATAPTGITFAGNPMTKVRDSNVSPGCSIWIYVPSGTTTGQVAVTTAAGGYGYVAFELTGLQFNVGDVGATKSGSSSQPSAGPTSATSVASEIGVACACFEPNNSPSNGWGSPFTLFPFAASAFTVSGVVYGLATACAALSATGTVTASYSLGSAPAAWSACVETFE